MILQGQEHIMSSKQVCYKPDCNSVCSYNFKLMIMLIDGATQSESVPDLKRTGVSFNSKFKSVSSWLMNSRSTRFSSISKKDKEIPGPGQYSPRTEMSKTGNYFLSKFQNTGTASLYKSNRKTINIKKGDRYGPGPGSYVLPSDFGYPTLGKIIQSKRRHAARSQSQLNNS